MKARSPIKLGVGLQLLLYAYQSTAQTTDSEQASKEAFDWMQLFIDSYTPLAEHLAWPAVVLLIFIVLLAEGSLLRLMRRLASEDIEYSSPTGQTIRVIGSEITREIETTIQRLAVTFKPEMDPRFERTSLDPQLASDIHRVEFLHSIKAEIKNVSAWNAVGSYYFRSDPQKAKKAYETAIKLGREPSSYANLGFLLHIRENHDEAKQNFAMAVRRAKFQKTPCPWGYAGMALMAIIDCKRLRGDGVDSQHQDYIKAESQIKECMSKAKAEFQVGTDFWSYHGLAWCYAYLENNWEEAMRWGNKALEQSRSEGVNFEVGRYNLACYLARNLEHGSSNAKKSVENLWGIITPNANATIKSFGFERDRDFESIKSSREFKQFCKCLGLEYNPRQVT